MPSAEEKMVNFELVLGGLWGSCLTYLLQSYLAKACTSESLQLHGMPSTLNPCSLCTTNLGMLTCLRQTDYISETNILTYLSYLAWNCNPQFVLTKDSEPCVWSLNVNARTSPSEFIIPYDQYMESLKHNYSIGMRFRMRFEGEEAPEQR
jgi:hypothetical protein